MKRILFPLMILGLLGVTACRSELAQEIGPTATMSATPIVELSETPTARPAPEDVARVVLREAAELICPHQDGPGELEFATREYRFQCTPAAGHGTGVRLEGYGSEAEARAAFDSGREASSVKQFHGFPLSEWGEDHPSFPGGRPEYQVWLWQVGRWVVEVRAFDDTPYLVAPNPEMVSETLLQVGIEHGLFPDDDGQGVGRIVGTGFQSACLTTRTGKYSSTLDC